MTSTKKEYGEETRILHTGYDPFDYHGVVNPPVVRASSILYPSLAAYEDPQTPYKYGRYATPLSKSFTDALAALEGGVGAICAPSGLSAITTSLLAFLKAGDHLLITDGLYSSARDFCDHVLPRMGVEVEYYAPCIGAGIEALLRPHTAVIYMESPSSATFDIQDVPAIVAAAKPKNITTIFDNSWASGVLYKPLAQGVDVSVLSATKYIGGHSDIMLGGVIARTQTHFELIQKMAQDLGVCAGSEELWLALRGLKTLSIRIKESGARALQIARWLVGQKGVKTVYHPALESHPNHALWKRDFTGCNGLLTLVLEPAPRAAIEAFTSSLTLFPIGSSWGGYESLLQPQYLKKHRTAVPWTEEGFVCRLQIGLEDVADLQADLEVALAAYNKAR